MSLASAPEAAGIAQDANALLKADQEPVAQQFIEYEMTQSGANKRALVAGTCTALHHTKVLSEYVKHRVQEEQNEMFHQAKSTKLDMKAVGAQLIGRTQQLLASGKM